jgi:hypothetical protein
MFWRAALASSLNLFLELSTSFELKNAKNLLVFYTIFWFPSKHKMHDETYHGIVLIRIIGNDITGSNNTENIVLIIHV